MFELEGGVTLALYPRSQLAKDAGIEVPPAGSGLFSIGHLVGSRPEVDELFERARGAGATVTEEPHERPWGIYSGYFRDPDGRLWGDHLEPVRQPPYLASSSSGRCPGHGLAGCPEPC